MSKVEMFGPEDLRGRITDLVSDFLYYDRENDEDLPLGYIEELTESGIVTRLEIVELFAQELTKGLRLK